jgi:hypothetical protein
LPGVGALTLTLTLTWGWDWNWNWGWRMVDSTNPSVYVFVGREEVEQALRNRVRFSV